MKDRLQAILLAAAFFGGLALAGSENPWMPWLNFLGVVLIGGAGMIATTWLR